MMRYQADRWELDQSWQAAIRRWRHAAQVPFYLAVDRLQGGSGADLQLHSPDILFLIWGTEEVFANEMSPALYFFEQRLLPKAEEYGPLWHGCVLLWSGIYRLYLCDPLSALGHVATAEELGLTAMIPEIMLLKGMALRLSGDPAAAVPILEPLSHEDTELFPDGRILARAWYLESRVSAGLGVAEVKGMKELQRWSRAIYDGSLGILHAALYRLVTSLGKQPIGIRAPKRLLAEMDRAAPYERPMLNMLLQDILPRPLEGIQPATEPPEAYWMDRPPFLISRDRGVPDG